MEPLDKLLTELAESYQKTSCPFDVSKIVQKKIKEKKEKMKILKIFGVVFATLMIIGSTISYSFYDYKSFGYFFQMYIYLSFSFALITFTIIAIMGSQKNIKKHLHYAIIDKINKTEIYFTEDEAPLLTEKAVLS